MFLVFYKDREIVYKRICFQIVLHRFLKSSRTYLIIVAKVPTEQITPHILLIQIQYFLSIYYVCSMGTVGWYIYPTNILMSQCCTKYTLLDLAGG